MQTTQYWICEDLTCFDSNIIGSLTKIPNVDDELVYLDVSTMLPVKTGKTVIAVENANSNSSIVLTLSDNSHVHLYSNLSA